MASASMATDALDPPDPTLPRPESPPRQPFPSISSPSSTSHRVSLPPDVLDAPPLWSSCVIGHFLGDAPNIALIHATVNRIWNTGRSGTSITKIGVQFLAKRSVLFRIPNSDVRDHVLERKFWHISFVPLVIQVWSPSTANSQPNMSNIPLWVDFLDVPDNVFSEPGLRFLSNQVGKFSKLHPNTERCIKLDVATTLVAIDLEKPLKTEIFIDGIEVPVKVNYPWLPDFCELCTSWGHSGKECGDTIRVLPQITTSSRAPISTAQHSHIVPELKAPEGNTESQRKAPAINPSVTHCQDTDVLATDALRKLLADLNAQNPATHTSNPPNDNPTDTQGWQEARRPIRRNSLSPVSSPKTSGPVSHSSAFAVLRDLDDSGQKEGNTTENTGSEENDAEISADTEEGEISSPSHSPTQQIGRVSAKKTKQQLKQVNTGKAPTKKKQIPMSFKDLIRNGPVKKQSSKAPLGGR